MRSIKQAIWAFYRSARKQSQSKHPAKYKVAHKPGKGATTDLLYYYLNLALISFCHVCCLYFKQQMIMFVLNCFSKTILQGL